MEERVIKGALISLDHPSFISKEFLGLILFGLLNLFALVLILFGEVPRYIEHQSIHTEALYFQLFILGLLTFIYWISSSQNYYYVFSKDSLTIRNHLKKYSYEIDYTDIAEIRFNISSLKLNGYENWVEFVIKKKESNGLYAKRFYSHCFLTSDWQLFFKTLDELGIKHEDPLLPKIDISK